MLYSSVWLSQQQKVSEKWHRPQEERDCCWSRRDKARQTPGIRERKKSKDSGMVGRQKVSGGQRGHETEKKKMRKTKIKEK